MKRVVLDYVLWFLALVAISLYLFGLFSFEKVVVVSLIAVLSFTASLKIRSAR